MRFIAVLFILIATLQAEIEEAAIVEKIFSHLAFPASVRIHTPYPAFAATLEKRFHIVSQCEKADLIVVKHPEDLPKGCPLPSQALFGLTYEILKRYPNAFGAFYWKKGRPNILLLSPRTKRLNIGIDSSLEKYTEERLW